MKIRRRKHNTTFQKESNFEMLVFRKITSNYIMKFVSQVRRLSRSSMRTVPRLPYVRRCQNIVSKGAEVLHYISIQQWFTRFWRTVKKIIQVIKKGKIVHGSLLVQCLSSFWLLLRISLFPFDLAGLAPFAFFSRLHGKHVERKNT